MVGALTGMKVAVLRHSVTGTRATWMVTGAVIGLALAAGTIAVATVAADRPTTVMDLLALVFAAWTLGWMLGPSFGGGPDLRPEHFALEPVARRRLAVGLLGAAFIGVPAAVTLVAFSATAVFAARLGTAAVVVAIPAIVLQLALAVVASRITGRMFAALARSRTGSAVTAVITAVMLVLSQSGWVVLVALDRVLATGFSPGVSLVLRALPPSWGLLAVEGAGRGDWAWTVGPLVALTVVVAGLVALWARSFGPQRLVGPVVQGSTAAGAAPPRWAARGATAAVYVKEMRTWVRSPLRVQSLVVAPVFAVLTALVPLAFDSGAFLPFVGAVTALMGAVTCANLYGQDGTALWLTLSVPGSERADVRGRQLAWLSLFAPLSLVLTVGGAVLHGDADLWPWALGATFALVGGGSGLVVAVATSQLVPGPDPHEIKSSPLDHGDVTGPSFVMLFSVLATAGPALGMALAGELLDRPLLTWAAVPIGLVTGVACSLRLGEAAVGRLTRNGPELLSRMQAGKEVDGPGGEGTSVLETMPRRRRGLLWTSVVVGCIALFPQAVVPAAMKLSGGVERLWFLALYLPAALQWPTIVLMAVLGGGAFGAAARIYFGERGRAAPPLGLRPGRTRPDS